MSPLGSAEGLELGVNASGLVTLGAILGLIWIGSIAFRNVFNPKR